jgi:sugar phosphate permease
MGEAAGRTGARDALRPEAETADNNRSGRDAMPSARTVDVQAFLNEHPFSPFQWLVFALCFCVVLMDGFDTAAIGYIAPSLVGEWGVERSALAPVLSAALFGLAFGALSAGPLADGFGRRTVLIGAALVFGLACLASASSGNLSQLVGLRFVTGLGLGAAMPNAATLMSEFCPDRRRATLTNGMFCGFPLGQTTGHLGALMVVMLLGGTLMNTAQSSLPALAAAFYPTAGRATGVSSMLGIGRFGGIAGSFLVGELSRRNLDLGSIFALVAVPGLIAAAALAVKQVAHPERGPAGLVVETEIALH